MKWSSETPSKPGYYWYLTAEAAIDYRPVVITLAFDGRWTIDGIALDVDDDARFLKIRKPHKPK
tara:strand:+ start:3051 stop:3242 length:192 start_codon:yes stop_codon:yes gene_type:complete